MSDVFVSRYGVSALTKQQTDNIKKLFVGEVWQHMSIKSPDGIGMMKAAGGVCAHVLDDVSQHIKPGVTLREIDKITHDLIIEKYGAEIVRLAVKTSGTGLAHTDKISASYALNEIVANAEASDRPLQVGDLFGIDVSAKKNGWSGDTAKKWIVGGEAPPLITSLYTVSLQVMWLVIGMVKPGVSLNELAEVATSFANKHGFNVIGTFPAVGHGIGREHNDGWFIPWSVGALNDGRVLQKGMTFSVEIYLTPGSGELAFLGKDVTSLVTADGAPASYWKHIVAVSDTGCDVLDLRKGEDSAWATLVPV
ncbi:methionine aminopeptidase, type I [Rhizobiales bacterium GAS191]|nr:methionine aminopeptidase, type I [Rhizobiales bacterium GAS191]